MGIEIERKFLIKDDSWRKMINKEVEIRQGYLNSHFERTVRVRIFGNRGMITVKGKTMNATRLEFEYEIPFQDAQALIELCEKPIIEKTRHLAQIDNKLWEIDVFVGENEGLIIAEVELEHVDEKIELPEWVGAEVTSQKKYYNSNLILHPYKTWEHSGSDSNH